MSTTARTLISGAFDLIGVKAPNETIDAPSAIDALRRLNNMVAGWRTQRLTVTSIDRQIFNLSANVQTYTIGLGGDFNVARPVALDGAGLLLNGLGSELSVTSITRASTTATVTLTAHGFAVDDVVYISGADQPAYNGLQTILTTPTADTFTYQVLLSPATPATGTILAQALSTSPAVEIPRSVITDDMYQAIQLKTLTNALFTAVYYNPTYAGQLGTIFLWPMPTTGANQLVLYLMNAFTGFADLDTTYDYPDTPGYADALEYNLAKRLCAPYGKPLPEDVNSFAVESLALIKRQNYRLSDLPNDAGRSIQGEPRFGYNIQTGQ